MASFILLRKGNIIARYRAWLKIPYKPLCQLATEGSRLHGFTFLGYFGSSKVLHGLLALVRAQSNSF